jgi:S-adenosylmethionine decarboxylase
MTAAAPPYHARHLIADLHGCEGLDDLERVRSALWSAAAAAEATVVDDRFHSFGPGQGVTGVLILAESHMTIHTWPEHNYAAVDIFMCGLRHDLEAALAAIEKALRPEQVVSQILARDGALPAQAPAPEFTTGGRC